MMNTYLCKRCGCRLDETMRTCPTCGALNIINSEVLAEEVKQIEHQQKEIKKFSMGFLTVSLIIGLILFIVNISLFISDSSMGIFGFIGAVSGGLAFVCSIISMTRIESAGKIIAISISISVWFLIMQLMFAF